MGSPAEGARDALPGQLLGGRYLVEREIASDETAIIYRARDARLDRPVAIKVLPAPFADDPARVRQFLDGARMAASDATVPQIYDSGEDGAIAFIVMELRDAANGPVDDDTTTVVPVVRHAERARPAPDVATDMPRRRPSSLAIGGVLVLLAACAVMAAVLLTGFGRSAPPAEATTKTQSASPTKAAATGNVEVPDTIGMSEAEAEQAARASGLTWRLEWRVDPSKPAGVYDQQPAAGTMVADGARFVMYAYRTQ